MHLRRAATAAALLLTTTGLAVLTATQGAFASQGGCTNYTGIHGYDVGVCVNDKGTGLTAYPDIYVNRSAGTGSCTITIQLWNDLNQRFGNDATVDCGSGHKVGNATSLNSPQTVHAFARLNLGGTQYAMGDSPSIRVGTVTYPNNQTGCVDWPVTKFLQTPWTNQVNGGTGTVTQMPDGYYNNNGGSGYHKGCDSTSSMNQYYALDVTMNPGGPVLAEGGAGTVVMAGDTQAGWASCGKTVVVDYGGGWWSAVCHLQSVSVQAGQSVTADTVIGHSGITGDYGGTAHLHFSLMQGAQLYSVNGVPYGVYGGHSAKPHHMFHLGNKGYYENITPGMTMSY
jgi:hypothetical protein